MFWQFVRDGERQARMVARASTAAPPFSVPVPAGRPTREEETQRSHLVHREFPVLLVYGKPCVNMLIDETRTIPHQCVGDAGSMP